MDQRDSVEHSQPQREMMTFSGRVAPFCIDFCVKQYPHQALSHIDRADAPDHSAWESLCMCVCVCVSNDLGCLRRPADRHQAGTGFD